MTLAELSVASGLAARTIRFYIARGLLEGPVKAGRGAVYTQEHLARLESIKNLQAQGRMLSEISSSLAGAVPERNAVQPTAWWQHAISEDVVVWTRSDVSPWRTRQIREAIGELARSLQPGDDGKRSKK